VTLVSPLAMNMYVSALPEIARALEADASSAQLSLVSFLVALAGGQIVYGAASDRFGRRRPLIAGLALFVCASIGASFSATMAQFVAWRFVQGFGACAAQAIPRAMIRDLHSGPSAARLMGSILLVVSIAPLLAPIIGSGLIAILPWTSIFWVLAVTGSIALILAIVCLDDTLPHQQRQQGGLGETGKALLELLCHRRFLFLTLTLSLGQASFYAYLGASSAVFITKFGLMPWQYSTVFAITAAGWAASAQITPFLMNRFGAERTTRAAASGGALIMVILLVAAAAGAVGPAILVVAVTLFFATLGVLNPILTVLALDSQGRSAGMASAILGMITFSLGATSSALVSALADGSEMPLLIVMTTLAMAALVSSSLGLPAHSKPGASAP
jgi:DHA1 family bicyclomycin/chloramphenicol resistance-like MFS transporter